MSNDSLNLLAQAAQAARKARQNIEEDRALRRQVANTGLADRERRKIFQTMTDFVCRVVGCERTNAEHTKALAALKLRIERLERMHTQ